MRVTDEVHKEAHVRVWVEELQEEAERDQIFALPNLLTVRVRAETEVDKSAYTNLSWGTNPLT